MQAFLREDLTRFCRDAPPEFTHPQRDVFCVFSGEGVSRLREYLKRLAEDQEREGRASREESVLYSEAEADSGRETISDDGTIDAPDEMAERRATLLPRPMGYRSYAEVVSGSGLNSPEGEDVGGSSHGGVPIPQTRRGRITSLFRPRSSRPGSYGEHDVTGPIRGYFNALGRREGSRSASEGQGSSSRSRFPHTEAPSFDDYFPAAETQSRRPLPPRPHGPPQHQTAEFYDSEQQIFAPDWGPFSAGPSSRNTAREPRLGMFPGPSGVRHGRERSPASAVYDPDDDDGEMTVRQQFSRRHRDMDGEMES